MSKNTYFYIQTQPPSYYAVDSGKSYDINRFTVEKLYKEEKVQRKNFPKNGSTKEGERRLVIHEDLFCYFLEYMVANSYTNFPAIALEKALASMGQDDGFDGRFSEEKRKRLSDKLSEERRLLGLTTHMIKVEFDDSGGYECELKCVRLVTLQEKKNTPSSEEKKERLFFLHMTKALFLQKLRNGVYPKIADAAKESKIWFHWRSYLFNDLERRPEFTSANSVCVWDFKNIMKRKYFKPENCWDVFYEVAQILSISGGKFSVALEDEKLYFKKTQASPQEILMLEDQSERITELKGEGKEMQKGGKNMSDNTAVLLFSEYLLMLRHLYACRGMKGVSSKVWEKIYKENILKGERVSGLNIITWMCEDGWVPIDTEADPDARGAYPKCSGIVWIKQGGEKELAIYLEEEEKARMETLRQEYPLEKLKDETQESISKLLQEKIVLYNSIPKKVVVPSGFLMQVASSKRKNQPAGEAEQGSKRPKEASRHDEDGGSFFEKYVQRQKAFFRNAKGRPLSKYLLDYVRHDYAPQMFMPETKKLLQDLNIKDEITMRVYLQIAVDSKDFPIRHLAGVLDMSRMHLRNQSNWTQAKMKDIEEDLQRFEARFIPFLLRQSNGGQPPKAKPKKEQIDLLKRLYCSHWTFIHNPKKSRLDSLYLNLYEDKDWLPLLLTPFIHRMSSLPPVEGVQTVLSDYLKLPLEAQKLEQIIPHFNLSPDLTGPEVSITRIIDSLYPKNQRATQQFKIMIKPLDVKNMDLHLECPIYFEPNQDMDRNWNATAELDYISAIDSLRKGEFASSASNIQHKQCLSTYLAKLSTPKLWEYFLTDYISIFPFKLPSKCLVLFLFCLSIRAPKISIDQNGVPQDKNAFYDTIGSHLHGAYVHFFIQKPPPFFYSSSDFDKLCHSFDDLTIKYNAFLQASHP